MLVCFCTLSDLYLLILESIQRIQIWRGGGFHEKFPMKREDWSLVIVIEKQIASLFHFSLCKTKSTLRFLDKYLNMKILFFANQKQPIIFCFSNTKSCLF